jgi:uncharacterized protein YkwD
MMELHSPTKSRVYMQQFVKDVNLINPRISFPLRLSERTVSMTQSVRRFASSLLLLGLVACGGGAGDGDLSASSLAVRQDATASEGLERFNTLRRDLQLPVLLRDSRLDHAAAKHSDYQAYNREITHTQTPGKLGYQTGWDALEGRITRSGYPLNAPYAIGEVISRTRSKSGEYAAEQLVTAIYHRFLIFQPMFSEVGVGAATSSRDDTYFTTNFAAPGLNSGIGRGNIAHYPVQNQEGVPVIFYSDQEVPDPVPCPKNGVGECIGPNPNEVGYPISVHADIYSRSMSRMVDIQVQVFTVRPEGGSELPVQPLWRSVDENSPRSAAAIVPLQVLARNTRYEVRFVGTVDGVPKDLAWSFRTAP